MCVDDICLKLDYKNDVMTGECMVSFASIINCGDDWEVVNFWDCDDVLKVYFLWMCKEVIGVI